MHEMSWLSLWTYHAAAATAVITAGSNFKNSNQWADEVTLCVVDTMSHAMAQDVVVTITIATASSCTLQLALDFTP